MSTPESSPKQDIQASTQIVDLQSIRNRAIQLLTNVAAILGAIIFFVSAYSAVTNQNWVLFGGYAIAFAGLVVISVVRRIPVRLRAFILTGVIYLIGVLEFSQTGLQGNGLIFFLGMVVLTTLLIGARPGYAALAVTIATILFDGFVASYNTPPSASFTFMPWASAILTFAFISVAIIATLTIILNSLESLLASQKRLTDDLEKQQATLEHSIEERTADLRQRADQLEVASQVAHSISQETDLDTLLSGSVDLIRSRFDFYHASIFLIDDAQEFAVLRASTGEAGRALLAQNHRLKVGAEGIVGYVTLRGEPRIALDVAEDTVHFKNPLLPDTRSEMAVPLRAGSQIIGALDVQSTVEKAFSAEDVKILQTIADQLAVAIQRATLLRKLQDTLQQMESGLSLYTRQAWRTRIRRSRKALAFRSRRSQIEPVADASSIIKAKKPRGNKSLVQIPLELRGTVLGVLQVQFEGEEAPADTVAMLRTLADRLTLALETARLLEEIQQRAEQEHLVGDISARVRNSTDIEKILQTTAQELGRSLGVDEVRIQLSTPAEQS